MQDNSNSYNEEQQKLLDRVKRLCRRSYPRHNWEGHLIPVVNTALKLQEQHGGNRFIVETGAYMHDIGRVLFDYLQKPPFKITHEVSGYHYTRFKLWQYGCEPETRKRISRCVLEHSGSGNSGLKPTSLESEIIMNADAISPFELWLYQMSIHYSSRGKDLKKTKEWFLKKLDISYQTKLTLPGARDYIDPIYNRIKQELNQIH